VTQTTQEINELEQTEDVLWAKYTAARARECESWQLEERFWHEYVMTGLQDAVARENWRKYSDLTDELRQSASDAYRAWQRVAYPLYGVPVRVENEEQSS
jgi:hypothetical protein